MKQLKSEMELDQMNRRARENVVKKIDSEEEDRSQTIQSNNEDFRISEIE